MEIAAGQLASRLGENKARCILVHGVEVLLVEEARDLVREHFKQRGFGDVTRHTAESGFDWSALTQSSRSLSLFAERRYIELRVPGGQFAEAGAIFLTDFLSAADDDTVLVILCGKLDKKALESKWYAAIAKQGIVVDTGTVPSARLPHWIQRRFSSAGVTCAKEVAARLAYYVEGNLLAADQEVRKLALILPTGAVLDEARLTSVIADHARFSLFALVDACVEGQAPRALRILHSLRREGTEPFVMVWALAREVRVLGQVGSALKAGESRDAVFRRHRIWASRGSMVIGALKRLGLTRLFAIHRQVAYLDRRAKGQERRLLGPADLWVEIEDVALALCGIQSVNQSHIPKPS